MSNVVRSPTALGLAWPLVLASALMFAAACTSDDASSDDASSDEGITTDTRSSSIDAEADQIEFLNRYVTLASPIEETEFHIIYRDNSTGRFPGPSDWVIRYAVRIDPSDLDEWTDGWIPDDAPSPWDDSVIADWDIDIAPTFFARGSAIRAVYGDDVVMELAQTT